MTNRLEIALACINNVKEALDGAMGLHPLQILTGDHDLAPQATFAFTVTELLDLWEALNDATSEIHLAAGHRFNIVATGKYGDPLDTYMPNTIVPEAESILREATENDGD